MNRVHELLEGLQRDSQDYKDIASSIKFDLGDVYTLFDMADLSTKTFLNIPFPICVFQFTHKQDVHFLFAKESGDITTWCHAWKRAGKGIHDNDVWVDVTKDGGFSARRRNGDALDASRILDNPQESPPDFWVLRAIIGGILCMEVFSCSNIIYVEHNPPKLINEKRIKKNKVPFFSYKTLHIKNEQKEITTNDENRKAHSSPRVHLRRGHIRKLQNGSRVWVRHCLVGDKNKGLVLHDYKVGKAL